MSDLPTTRNARGTFIVDSRRQRLIHLIVGAVTEDYALDKQFRGDLEALSRVEILDVGDLGLGTSDYIAIEQISGCLHGNSGSFALQHICTINSGKIVIAATVVPRSGTGELVGIVGVMYFTLAKGGKDYEFEYMLPKLAKIGSSGQRS
jgi:hypothetical protein